ncbi:MAG: GNAT family N-acetyltransferase [Nocardioides sp.]
MTELVRPAVRFRESWAAAVTEFGDEPMHGSGLWDFDPVDVSEAGCAEVVAHLLSRGDTSVPLPEGIVHSDYLWLVDGSGFVGYLALRHALTPFLLEEGGHIGFSVRPSRRCEGHATRALALALPRAAALGLERVLVTCDDDNEGSRRTIERNDGVYEDTRKGKRRYWIELG